MPFDCSWPQCQGGRSHKGSKFPLASSMDGHHVRLDVIIKHVIAKAYTRLRNDLTLELGNRNRRCSTQCMGVLPEPCARRASFRVLLVPQIHNA